MSYNTVFSDAEFSKASNTFSSYSEFLLQSIEKYQKTITDLIEDGLIMQQTDAALAEHLIGVISTTASLNELSERENLLPTNMEKELIQADAFLYPGNLLAAVSSFLATFL